MICMPCQGIHSNITIPTPDNGNTKAQELINDICLYAWKSDATARNTDLSKRNDAVYSSQHGVNRTSYPSEVGRKSVRKRQKR